MKEMGLNVKGSGPLRHVFWITWKGESDGQERKKSHGRVFIEVFE